MLLYNLVKFAQKLHENENAIYNDSLVEVF